MSNKNVTYISVFLSMIVLSWICTGRGRMGESLVLPQVTKLFFC